MRRDNGFVPIKTISGRRKTTNLELNFIPNKVSALRKEKSRPENQLEPDLNEVQRFAKRGVR